MKRHGVSIGVAVLALVGVGQVAVGSPAAASTRTAAQTTQAPDIPVNAVMTHLEELQAVANANGGNRATGTAGYRASLSYVRGELDEAGFQTRVQRFSTRYGNSANLLATYPGDSSSDEVVMVGAHLDSVYAGPGINDNGSGSAAVLQVALSLAASGFDPAPTLRFAWWGAEEQGLLGSRHYVRSLTSRQRSAVSAYLNADMVASPNAGYFVYGGEGYESEQLKVAYTSYFDSIGVPTEGLNISGRSDHAPFLNAGIPAAGASTGAGARKTATQARKWGGAAGRPYDPCYHRSCDTIRNINPTPLNRMSDAFASAVWELSSGDDEGQPPDPPEGDTYTNDTDHAISGSASSTVDVNVTGQVPSSVTVSVSAKHECAKSVGLLLVPPSGQSYWVKTPGYGACEPFSTRAFVVDGLGSAAAGSWTLRVYDYYGYTGTLTSWSLTL